MIEVQKDKINFGLPNPTTEKSIPIIFIESLILFKLWWYRSKDISDLEILLKMNKDEIDKSFVKEMNSFHKEFNFESMKTRIKTWEKLIN